MGSMNDLETHINSFLVNDSTSRYFVACSGGVDSMVLLHILHKLGKRVSALHVNYLLRGDDSEADQELVERTCKEKQIPCQVKRVDLNKYLSVSGGNLQDEARKVRYSYFETFKLKSDYKVVLGQHADDQVETFFLNLARGSGIMGLSCMLPEHNNYLRPLLPFYKDEILAYAKENGIIWREDKSNASNKYSRNKLRNVLLPELKKEIPSLQESVLLLTKTFQDTQKELDISVQQYVRNIEERGDLSIEQLDRLNEFELMEILRQLDLPSGVHSELLKLRSSAKGKRIDLEHEVYQSIIREENYLHFTTSQPAHILPQLEVVRVLNLPKSFSKDVIYLDPEKINGDLKIRTWRIGDRMRPIGMKGSKLISDILSDAKIPNHVRQHQLVVHDNQKIVWCVGFAVGRDAVVVNGGEILKVSCK